MKKYILGLIFISVIAQASFFADNNVIEGVSTIPSNGGASTLLYNNNKNIVITGSSNHTIKLPSATSMRVGNSFKLFNEGTGTVTVQYNDGTAIHTLATNEWSEYLLTSNATSNGTWVISEPIPGGGVSAVSLTSDVTGVLPLLNGGTNNAMVANSGGVAYSGSSAVHITAPGSSGNLLQSAGTGIPAFVAISTIDHGGFGGQTDDDHTQYALLAGRSGGQSVVGSTAASENLFLSSTSNATKGQVIVAENTDATSTTTGALRVNGGIGTAGSAFFGGSVVSLTGLTLEDPGTGTHKLHITAPTLAATYSFMLPANNGVANQFLQTNGSGALSWVDAVAGASVVTTNASGVRISSAYLTNTGSCAVSTQDGSWISSVSDPGTGRCGITMAGGTWSDTPRCVCSSDAGNDNFCQVTVSSSTSITVNTDNHDGSFEDIGFNIICIGTK